MNPATCETIGISAPRNTRYRGTSRTSAGNMLVMTIAVRIPRRKGMFKRARAYPAKAAMMTQAMVALTDTTAELSMKRANGSCSNT